MPPLLAHCSARACCAGDGGGVTAGRVRPNSWCRQRSVTCACITKGSIGWASWTAQLRWSRRKLWYWRCHSQAFCKRRCCGGDPGAGDRRRRSRHDRSHRGRRRASDCHSGRRRRRAGGRLGCDQVRAAFGKATILVNSAGVDASGIPVADMELAQFEAVLRTNLIGPFCAPVPSSGARRPMPEAGSSTSAQCTRICRGRALPITAHPRVDCAI